jgi:signal transduction histidine kinase/CheY-like chemotaxis protein
LQFFNQAPSIAAGGYRMITGVDEMSEKIGRSSRLKGICLLFAAALLISFVALFCSATAAPPPSAPPAAPSNGPDTALPTGRPAPPPTSPPAAPSAAPPNGRPAAPANSSPTLPAVPPNAPPRGGDRPPLPSSQQISPIGEGEVVRWLGFKNGDSPVRADGTYEWTTIEPREWGAMFDVGRHKAGIAASDEPYLWLTTVLTPESADHPILDPYLLFVSPTYDFELYSGTRMIYRHHNSPASSTTLQDGVPVFVSLADTDRSEPIYLRIHSKLDKALSGKIGPVLLGSQAKLKMGIIRADFSSYAGILLFFLIGFVALLMYFMNSDNRASLYFALFSWMISAYILISLRSPSLFIPLSAIREYATWPIKGALGYVFILYFQKIVDMANTKLLRAVGSAVCFLGLIVPFAVYLFPDFLQEQNRAVTLGQHLGFAALCLLILANMLVSFRRRVSKDAVWLTAGFSLYLLVNIVGQPLRFYLESNQNKFGISPYNFIQVFNAAQLYTLLFGTIFLGLISFRRYSEVYRKIRNYNTQLELKNKELERMDELKDHFLANTSHELRTPLNGIIGLSESLADGAAGPLADEALYNIRMIAASGRRLSHLVNDILDFSKIRHDEIKLQPKPLDLRSLVDVVLVTLRPLAAGKPILIENLVPHACFVMADENRLQQILFNLIGNAVKFTDSGAIQVTASGEEAIWRVHVTDTGIGIAQEKLNEIFDAFVQADGSDSRAYGGTGLGLAISKQLVELHGGQLNAVSKVGEGSTFSFSLPATAEEAAAETVRLAASTVESASAEAAVAEAVAVEAPPAGLPGEAVQAMDTRPLQLDGQITGSDILIVDDEAVNLQVLRNYLTMENCRVTQAADPRQALELLLGGFRPDLIVLDVMMPGMSGYELCRTIRERVSSPSSLPILLLTAKNQVSDLVEGFHSGANDYVTKPVAKSELIARIELHLRLTRWNSSLERKVEERTRAIQNLLDHAGQGFLTIDREQIVQQEYSIECRRLFGQDIAGCRYGELLYADEGEDRAFLEEIVAAAFAADESQKDVFLSLLPEALELRGYSITVQYKWISEPGTNSEKIMVVLTDVSERRELQDQMEKERRLLHSVVWVIKHYRDFKEMIDEYRAFAAGGWKSIVHRERDAAESWGELERALHTFKGNFAQIDFLVMTERLHELESRVSEWRSREDLAAFMAWFDSLDWFGWLEEDLRSLRNILGERFDSEEERVNIEIDKLRRIERKVAEMVPGEPGAAIVAELRKLQYRPLDELLEAYSEYTKRLAERMGKPIEPVVITGERVPVDPTRFMGFVRSLIHVFRNMVDHGIESAETRGATGKSLRGTIGCEIAAVGPMIRLVIFNDGAPLDVEQIKRRVLAKGICTEAELAEMSDGEAAMLIFRERFTTRTEVNSLSGRGIGLSAVQSAVAALNGSIRVDSRPDRTEFVFLLPIEE